MVYSVLPGKVTVVFLSATNKLWPGKIGEMKKGGFHMAINTGISIIPVGVSGAFDFKPKNRWWFRPVPITINIGNAISPSIYSELGIDGLINKVGQAIKTLSGGTNEAE